MRFSILLGVFCSCLVANATATAEGTDFTLYLVRHAEKHLDGSRDPGLTETGQNRSVQLANWFEDKKINDIWSSDYRRTRNTAAPLLSRLGLELRIYNPGDQESLTEKLLERRNTALVIGHSNTIPQLARLLCQCFIADMEDSEHDRLITISVVDGETRTEIHQQHKLFQP